MICSSEGRYTSFNDGGNGGGGVLRGSQSPQQRRLSQMMAGSHSPQQRRLSQMLEQQEVSEADQTSSSCDILREDRFVN